MTQFKHGFNIPEVFATAGNMLATFLMDQAGDKFLESEMFQVSQISKILQSKCVSYS